MSSQACLVEATVMTTPQWRVSSHISKDSTLMIYEVWLRHKVELKNIFIFTTTEDRNENERS